MSSICITGIGGYLGLATAYKLVEEGYSVVGIGSNENAPENLPRGVVYAGIDIRDVAALASFFTTHQVTTVYHFAGIKYVGKCEADPELCYAINTEGTSAVVAAMEQARVSHIVYASTYVVYDLAKDHILLTESSPTKPTTVYGMSKLKSETHILEAHAAGKITQYHIMRYGNIIGAVPEVIRHTAQNFIDKVALATYTGESITINGDTYHTIDGSSARDFADIRDVVSANLLVLTDTQSNIYNVSSGEATTLKQLIMQCEKVSGKSLTVTVSPKTGNEPSSITIENTCIKNVLGFYPRYSLRETVALLITKLAP